MRRVVPNSTKKYGKPRRIWRFTWDVGTPKWVRWKKQTFPGNSMQWTSEAFQEPIQMQRLKVFSAPCSAPVGVLFRKPKCHLRILVAIGFIHGWNSKKRRHAQGCESPNAETWWWWGCLQTSATMELVGFGEFGGSKSVQPHQPCYPKVQPCSTFGKGGFNPLWPVDSDVNVHWKKRMWSWHMFNHLPIGINWEQKHVEMTGDNVLDVKKYHGTAFSKYSTSGWDSSKRNPPPRTKTATQLLSFAGLSPSPSMRELTPSACFKLGCYPAAPRLWPPRLHA